MFSRLMGIPVEKCHNLIIMMPFVVFEVKNYAIARKLKSLLAPMESLGFPILISMEAGPISRVNWPKGIKLNGIPVDQLIDSVPEFVNLMNQCPSCGLELRYQISLRIENENIKFPLNADAMVEETRSSSLEADSEIHDELVEMEEIEELTDFDETDGSEPSVSEEFVAQAVDAEDMDPDMAAELFGDLDMAESVSTSPKAKKVHATASFSEEFDMNDVGISLNVNDSKSLGEKGEYHIALGVLKSINDKIKAAKLLSDILGVAESEAIHKVKRVGDIIIPNVTLEEAKVYKKMFSQCNLNVKITN